MLPVYALLPVKAALSRDGGQNSEDGGVGKLTAKENEDDDECSLPDRGRNKSGEGVGASSRGWNGGEAVRVPDGADAARRRSTICTPSLGTETPGLRFGAGLVRTGEGALLDTPAVSERDVIGGDIGVCCSSMPFETGSGMHRHAKTANAVSFITLSLECTALQRTGPHPPASRVGVCTPPVHSDSSVVSAHRFASFHAYICTLYSACELAPILNVHEHETPEHTLHYSRCEVLHGIQPVRGANIHIAYT
jgi:hypothetical protein